MVEVGGPVWLFGVMFMGGQAFLVAGALLWLLYMRPKPEPATRGHVVSGAVAFTVPTALFLWGQYDLDGWAGLRGGVVMTLGAVLAIVPFVVLVEKGISAARMGRDLTGGWLRARTVARIALVVLTVACGGVVWVTFMLQFLFMDSC